MSCQKFFDTPVNIEPHKTLNSCKGVVRSPEFAHVSEQDVIEHLKPQGVSDAKRINRKVNGQLTPTNTFILTFNLTELPKEIRLATWLNVRVDAYVPNPLRCYNCQLFGHHKDRCKRDLACARCGVPKHGSDNCVEAEHCINCGGNHTAFSKDCPKWKVEREVVRVKHTRNIPFSEARKIVDLQSNPVPTFSYAAATAARKPGISVSTQTDISWKPAEQTTITWPYNAPNYKPTTSSSSSSQTQRSSQKKTPGGQSSKASTRRGPSPKASTPARRSPSPKASTSRETPGGKGPKTPTRNARSPQPSTSRESPGGQGKKAASTEKFRQRQTPRERISLKDSVLDRGPDSLLNYKIDTKG